MNAIEIARKLAALGSAAEACKAYTLALHTGAEPAEELEAAAYILQFGGDYKVSYTTFIKLFNQGYFREDILPLMAKVFYEPNVKLLKSRYERNCKLLKKYRYLFRKDFPSFEELPICFFPYDDQNGYVPFYTEEERFGDFVNFKDPVVSRNFFKDLEKPVLAEDVYSQYELEYLRDNVRRSEDVGRENHVYLHYSDWSEFCSYLQCLTLRPLLEEEKLVFLIGEEISQYPIDFQERFGIDYSQYPVKPVGVREVNRLIWHTQLSTHNGGDFFNEVFDSHPNLLVLPSVMMKDMERVVGEIRNALEQRPALEELIEFYKDWLTPQVMTELYAMRTPTDKDIMVGVYLCDKTASGKLDRASRIVPAVFFQPHFTNIVYTLRVDERNNTVLESETDEEIHKSPFFRYFKYVKTFTPLRRFTVSHGATVRFMYMWALMDEEKVKKGEKNERGEDAKTTVVSDVITERVLNRSFMIDPQDRLYRDSVLVRFEDGKLNAKATFTALAAFLDLPYTQSMTYCSQGDILNPHVDTKGFDPAPVYKTYDEFVNDSERYYIEYFLRDAYEYYGYDFQTYDGAEVDEERAKELISGFTTLDKYVRETWKFVTDKAEISQNGQRIEGEMEKEIQDQLLEHYMEEFGKNRLRNSKILLEGLRFVNKNGQPLRMMRRLELDPELMEQPLYH